MDWPRPIVLVCTLVGATGGVGFAADATAQESQPSAEDLSRQYFRKGQIQYNLGRFEQAAEEYAKAYELMPLPEFLFNIGQCHKKAGDYRKAVFFYEGYLRENPQAENRALVEDLIVEANAKIKESGEAARSSREKPRRDEEKAAASEAKTKPVRQVAGSAPATSRARSNRSGSSPESVEGTDRPFYGTWWFWTAVGGTTLVVATVAAAAILWIAVPGSRPVLSLGLVGAE